jgi:hypothetical protein
MPQVRSDTKFPNRTLPGEYFNRTGRVELSSSDRTTLNRLTYLYYLWTAKRITVTSGTRTPREQAEAMYENWYYHRNQSTRYQNRVAEGEIRGAYDGSIAARRGRNATVDAMTSVIENQVRHRTFISLHLTGRAVDVRTRDMSAADTHVFDSIVRNFAGTIRVLAEEDHYHLQFS